jgi:hypothetical protein
MPGFNPIAFAAPASAMVTGVFPEPPTLKLPTQSTGSPIFSRGALRRRLAATAA